MVGEEMANVIMADGEWKNGELINGRCVGFNLVTKHCSAFIVTSRPKKFAVRHSFVRHWKFAIKKKRPVPGSLFIYSNGVLLISDTKLYSPVLCATRCCFVIANRFFLAITSCS